MNYQSESLPPLSLADADSDQEAYRQWKTLSAYITDGPCREWELRWDSDAQEGVLKGTKAATFRGEVHTITDGRAPHKPGSTGRVYTAEGNEYYPSVFDMKWVNTQE
jgi:hypothetical protein